jgi:hypothetical protein
MSAFFLTVADSPATLGYNTGEKNNCFLESSLSLNTTHLPRNATHRIGHLERQDMAEAHWI